MPKTANLELEELKIGLFLYLVKLIYQKQMHIKKEIVHTSKARPIKFVILLKLT